MAEYTAVNAQTVAANGNVLFTDTVTDCCRVKHRSGSGLFRLRSSNCRPSYYRVMFAGNVAIPTGATVQAINIAIAIDGEPLTASTATVTPAAVDEQNNIVAMAIVEAGAGCCALVSVENTTAVSIAVTNANIIIEPVCAC